MKTISMLDFRKNAAATLRDVQRGHRLLLSFRGRPVAELRPVESRKKRLSPEDPLLQLLDKAEKDPLLRSGKSLTNEQIDAILYARP